MFGVDLIVAGLWPALTVALFSGVLSFLSPCVLPIVPPYLAYMSGVGLSDLAAPQGGDAQTTPRQSRGKLLRAAFGFVLGLSTVFLLLGLAASAFVAFFLINREVFSVVGGAMVTVFGLHFLGVFRIALLDRDVRMDAGDRGGSALGAYVLGLAFAFGWTPCIGPQLGAILTLAASEGSLPRGTLLLGVYALGLGVPFLLTALFVQRAVGIMARLKRHMKRIEQVMGAMLVLVGVALMTGVFSRVSFWLLEMFPALAALS